MKFGLKTIPFLFAALFSVMLFAGCSVQPDVPEPVESAAPTARPAADIVDLAALPTATPPAVTPTPTPEPTATPVPKSLYAPTIDMTYEELVGSTDDAKASTEDCVGEGFPPADKYYIIVDKYWQVTMVYMRKEVSGSTRGEPDYDRPVRYMLCSTGNPDKEYGHETTSGIWPIDLPRERWYQFINLEAAQYLTNIHSRTYFHSVLYKTKGDLSTLLRDSYDNLGRKMSHACIRLTVPDARWIFYNIAPGTTCEIRDGSADDIRTAEIRELLKLPPSKKDPVLRTKDYVWTDNWSISDLEHVVPYKYMRPRVPDGYDENGNKIVQENTPPPVIDPTEDPGGETPPPGGNSGGDNGGSSGGGTVTDDGFIVPDYNGD